MAPMSPLAQVIVLGVLQGITEFLPVSSSGHLALGQMLFGMDDPSLTLNVMLHGGTLFATLWFVRRRLADIIALLVKCIGNPRLLTTTPAGQDVIFVVFASIPTGMIGLSIHDAVARWTSSPLVVAVGFFVTAGVLVSSRWAPIGAERHPSLGQALLAGMVQGIAVLPGISRSGSTIGAALWMGIRPDRAVELSMLMSIPAVLGAVVLEVGFVGSGEVSWALMAFGAAIAFVVGLGALWVLRHSVARGYFGFYAVWVLPVAFATLALAWAWPVRPAP
jgi:undecaprenyl-diphosphatase